MKTKTLIGYHTTQKDNVDSILLHGFYPSIGDKHWLGEGVYFFEDIYYAIEWAIIGLPDENIHSYSEYEQKCSILASTIDIKNYTMIDLSSPLGYKIFTEMFTILEQNYNQEKYSKMYRRGYKYIIKLLENIEKTTKILCLSRFDVVCAVYHKDIYDIISDNKPSDFIVCAQKQICVKNTSAIRHTEVYEDKEQYQKFKILTENRGDVEL